MVKSVLWMIVVAFVATIFYSWGMGGATKFQGGVVATVDGVEIRFGEYDQSLNNLVEFYREQFQGQFSEEMIQTLDLKTSALDALIQKKLLLQEAEKQNITISNEELIQRVKSIPTFQKDKSFSPSLYNNYLNFRRLTAKEFEESQRDILVIEKMEIIIRSNIKIPEADVLAAYEMENDKVRLAYISIAKDHFSPAKEPTEEELKTFFEANKQEFLIPEQIKVEYIKLVPKSVEHQINLRDDDIKDYYERNLINYKIKKKYKAHHILFRVLPSGGDDPDASLEEENKIKIQAEEILQEIKDGADFGKMAKEHSDDKVSGNNNGDLGQFSKGVMVPEFEAALDKMEVGQLSGLVRTPFGFHIIRLNAVSKERKQPLSEVEESIIKALKEKKGRQRIRTMIKRIRKAAATDNGLSKAALEYKVETKTTGYISRNSHSIPDIGIVPEFFNLAFSLKDGEVSEPLNLPEQSLLLKVVERKAPYTPEFSAVIEDVKNLVVKNISETFTIAQLQKLSHENDLEKVARDLKLEVRETPLFSQADSIPGIGNINSIKAKVFAMKTGETAFGVTRASHYLLKVIEKEPPGEPSPEDTREIYAQLKRERASLVFQEWLRNIRDKADILIDKSLL